MSSYASKIRKGFYKNSTSERENDPGSQHVNNLATLEQILSYYGLPSCSGQPHFGRQSTSTRRHVSASARLTLLSHYYIILHFLKHEGEKENKCHFTRKGEINLNERKLVLETEGSTKIGTTVSFSKILNTIH